MLLGGVAVPQVLAAAASIGYEPTWTGAGAWTFDLMNAASGGLMEGIQALRASPVADAPDYEEFLARLHDARDPDPTDEIAYAGWSGGRFLEEVLTRLDGELTRERLLQELEQTKNDPISVEPYPSIWYGPDRHYGSDEAVPSQVVDGHWTVTGEPASRFE